MDNPNYTEKRKFERVDASIGMKIDFDGYDAFSNQAGSIDAKTKNISLEGACFLSGKRFCPGEYIRIHLKPSEEIEPIRIVGQVIWMRPTNKDAESEAYETSVSLSLPEKEEEERFTDYVKSIMKGYA